MDYVKNDTFVEQLVEIKRTGKIKAVKVLIWVMCILLGLGLLASCILYRPAAFILMLLACGVFALPYFLCSQLNNEFEYIYTNREIDIDRIINQKKRIRMANFTCDDIQKIEKYDPKKHYTIKERRINCYFACTPDENAYAFFISHPRNKYYILVMTPDEEFKDALKKGLPYLMKKSFD